MEKWFFTFGVGHLMKDYIICISGTYQETRQQMIEQFGKKWCGQYDEKYAKCLIEEYNYKIIEV